MQTIVIDLKKPALKAVTSLHLADPDVYVKTFFRISSGYVWGQGHPKELSKKFKEEIPQILTKLGFTVHEPKLACGCYEGTRGIERLYCHPQDLSGYIKQASIPQIEEVLKTATSFKLRNLDTFDEAFNYTVEEFKQELALAKGEIEQEILAVFQTKRSNLFRGPGAINLVHTKIARMDRPELNVAYHEFMDDLFMQLLTQGKIVKGQVRFGDAFRTVPIKKAGVKGIGNTRDLFSS